MTCDRLLTEREAAARLSISTSMIRKLRRLNRIEFVAIGRCPRYTAAGLDAYIARNTRRATTHLAAVRGGRRP